jgi:hypothetical protein
MIPIDTRTTGPFTHLLHGGSIPREVICTSRSDLWRSASNTKHLRQEAIPALLAHQTPPRAQGLSRRGYRHDRRGVAPHAQAARAQRSQGDGAVCLRRPAPGRRSVRSGPSTARVTSHAWCRARYSQGCRDALGARVTPGPRWVQLAPPCVTSAKPKEDHVGRRGRRGGSQGRAQGRVRGRVRERVQGRPQQGRPTRGGQEGAGRKHGTFDVDAVEGYANRLRDQLGGSSGLSGRSGLSGAASGLAGAASGLAGGSLASRLASGRSEASEEDFENEVRERLDLIDERLQQLEDEMLQLREGEGATEDLAEPAGEPDPEINP